ncbi:MAG: 23S rRNA (guanosine(2251)-2'-O)-methyltransferase RlmB [Alistipes sp.]|jgi:23S rRNA (guanosine2251-2'-O)-methyltransferase|nr:23S rRNA (guanosine(2251)-2'-O)-methyltransferase RlmB [Alistipes sp.]
MKNLVFGLRPVIEAIEAGRQIEKIYVKKGADGQLIGELREVARAQHIHVQEVPVEKLDRLVRPIAARGRDGRGAERDGGHGGGRAAVNHQGVVAQISEIVYAELDEILAAIPEGTAGLVVVFDGVTDVRNFGAIARTAECAGAHGLIVPIKNAAPVNADAMKASAGALNVIPVCRAGSVRNALKLLQAEGFQVVAASEKASATLYSADLTQPTAIVMGSEEDGISKEVLKLCDAQISIPLRGRIESLNVGAAAAVMLYEAVRQRHGSSSGNAGEGAEAGTRNE